MATVEVTFTPLPVHVRTARLVAMAVARRCGVADSLLDEVRLAVGEACSRAVEAHQRHCPGQPIRVTLTDDGEQFQVVVTDAAPGSEHDLPAGLGLPAGADPPGGPRLSAVGRPVGIRAEGGNGAAPGTGLPFPVDGTVPLRLPEGVGLAVIVGLADDVRIESAGQGTIVTMTWKRRSPVF
jgi:anti-sigma regulatory factor (Ser/Thr protein kinase)